MHQPVTHRPGVARASVTHCTAWILSPQCLLRSQDYSTCIEETLKTTMYGRDFSLTRIAETAQLVHLCVPRPPLPSATTFFTPGICFSPMHRPLDNSNLSSKRTTSLARGSFGLPHRLTQETDDALSHRIRVRSPSFLVWSFSRMIMHDAVTIIPRSSRRLMNVLEDGRLAESSRETASPRGS